MKQELLKISLREQAIYLPEELIKQQPETLNKTTLALVANAAKLGFGFSEELLNAFSCLPEVKARMVLHVLREVTGVGKNWTPMVKDWLNPTGESVTDHVITMFANLFNRKKESKLSCGHIIPANTFPLERYNGCPFCKTPFQFDNTVHFGQGSKLKVLELWTEKDLCSYMGRLIESKVALDATQQDSLKVLLKEFPVEANIQVGIKETAMLIIDALVANDRANEAQQFFKTPHDILRYLWYKHTGFIQVIEPKVIISRTTENSAYAYQNLSTRAVNHLKTKAGLKLKYSRAEARMAANWMNNLELPIDKICEIMHPKREMWVRFIRALRWAEYSKRKGFDQLAAIMDTFYNKSYTVWAGDLEKSRMKFDEERAFALLKQRPGLFARSLFANIIWFGGDKTLTHFSEIVDQVPARLLITLAMYARLYFDKDAIRVVSPLGGTTKRIGSNKLLKFFTEEELKNIYTTIEEYCLSVIKDRFARKEFNYKSIYIDKGLYNIPLSIGDRSDTIQDLPSALMGTKFPVEGNKVRLFMQWGMGLPAQQLDMDLSCKVAYADRTEFCSYANLSITGCQHSGDVINIPHMKGTAEYIELSLDELYCNSAEYVTFTCNAYSSGSLVPELVVGWMNSQYPMRVSENGVAYDPSCVQHQVSITQGLNKGLVFGVLDVKKREIIWLEMSFGGQVVQNLDYKTVKGLLAKLDSKLTLGSLIEQKAMAHEFKIVNNENEAEKTYTMQWASNSTVINELLDELE